jgi:hypothetical protein
MCKYTYKTKYKLLIMSTVLEDEHFDEGLIKFSDPSTFHDMSCYYVNHVDDKLYVKSGYIKLKNGIMDSQFKKPEDGPNNSYKLFLNKQDSVQILKNVLTKINTKLLTLVDTDKNVKSAKEKKQKVNIYGLIREKTIIPKTDGVVKEDSKEENENKLVLPFINFKFNDKTKIFIRHKLDYFEYKQEEALKDIGKFLNKDMLVRFVLHIDSVKIKKFTNSTEVYMGIKLKQLEVALSDDKFSSMIDGNKIIKIMELQPKAKYEKYEKKKYGALMKESNSEIFNIIKTDGIIKNKRYKELNKIF